MIRTIKNSFLIFWATAVLFICVGSLINFHQHKIWGKPLLPQLLYTKRDKEKSFEHFKIHNPEFSGGNHHHPVIDFITTQDQPLSLILNGKADRTSGTTLHILLQEFLSSRSLRAPPVA